MKIYYICILAVLPLLCHSYPAEEAEKAIVVEDSDHAESESSQISKRSGGSFDIVQHLKSGLLSGVGRASASFASSSSGGSGGGYKGGEHSNSVDFDPWTLKKSVLNTIFQAVKAITGGVTAIKGQLIKGSGYALSASGKLVAASGDKVTNVGKAIVNSAQLVPAHGHGGSGSGSHPLIGKLSGLSGASSSSSSGHGHSAPVGHSETITTYEIPSGHGSYGPPSKAPSYPTATHQYLPPGAFSGGAPFTGHAAFEGSPSLSYQPSKYGISVEGQSSGHYGPLSQREAQSASKALKEIIHLLPFTKPKATTEAPSHTYKVVEQYSIPSDPIPDYKPVIETITHSQSLTTAYDGSFPSSPSASEDNFISNDQYPSNSNNYDSPQAYDVYRAMAKKYKNTDPSPSYTTSNKQPVTSTIVITSGTKGNNGYTYNQGSQLGPIYASASQKHTFYVPPPRNTHRFQSKQDFRYRPRRPQAPPSRRKNFEIYKSKGYQIRDPAQFNRQLLY